MDQDEILEYVNSVKKCHIKDEKDDVRNHFINVEGDIDEYCRSHGSKPMEEQFADLNNGEKTPMELLHEKYSHQHLIDQSTVKWYTVEEAIQFVENNIRKICKAKGKL